MNAHRKQAFAESSLVKYYYPCVCDSFEKIHWRLMKNCSTYESTKLFQRWAVKRATSWRVANRWMYVGDMMAIYELIKAHLVGTRLLTLLRKIMKKFQEGFVSEGRVATCGINRQSASRSYRCQWFCVPCTGPRLDLLGGEVSDNNPPLEKSIKPITSMVVTKVKSKLLRCWAATKTFGQKRHRAPYFHLWDSIYCSARRIWHSLRVE